MAIPQNQIAGTASEAVLNLARALGLEIEIKGTQEYQEPQKRKHKGRKLPKVLTPQQVEKLLEPINTKCATGIRNMAAFMTMYKAGLRVSEICSVTPADIDLVSGKIFIQNGKGGKDRIAQYQVVCYLNGEIWGEIYYRCGKSEFMPLEAEKASAPTPA